MAPYTQGAPYLSCSATREQNMLDVFYFRLAHRATPHICDVFVRQDHMARDTPMKGPPCNILTLPGIESFHNFRPVHLFMNSTFFFQPTNSVFLS